MIVKNKDLIKMLQKHDPELEVVIGDDWMEITRVYEDVNEINGRVIQGPVLVID